MLGRVVWVADAVGRTGARDAHGRRRRARAHLRAGGRRGSAGDYKLVVDTRLEDVCGNRVGEPFEVDVFKPVTRKIESKTFERPFTVR